MAPQPGDREAGEPQRQGASPAGIERRCPAVAKQRGAKSIRHHETTFLGDQELRKVVWNREIKSICKIAVGDPLAIGTEIGDRTLDLDDHEVAVLPKAKNISAATVGERKLQKAGIAELVQRTAYTAREQRGGRCGVESGRDRHGQWHIIGKTDGTGEMDGE